MLYQIMATRTATVRRGESDWTTTTQIPTFYLDDTVQGIVDADHAEAIARDILGVGHRGFPWTVSVHAEPFQSIHD